MRVGIVGRGADFPVFDIDPHGKCEVLVPNGIDLIDGAVGPLQHVLDHKFVLARVGQGYPPFAQANPSSQSQDR